jgi:hypothetical protein
MDARTVFTSFYLQLRNGPNKLECVIMPGWKSLPGSNTQAYWANSEPPPSVKLPYLAVHEHPLVLGNLIALENQDTSDLILLCSISSDCTTVKCTEPSPSVMLPWLNLIVSCSFKTDR